MELKLKLSHQIILPPRASFNRTSMELKRKTSDCRICASKLWLFNRTSMELKQSIFVEIRLTDAYYFLIEQYGMKHARRRTMADWKTYLLIEPVWN